jgi:hypothetical protein
LSVFTVITKSSAGVAGVLGIAAAGWMKMPATSTTSRKAINTIEGLPATFWIFAFIFIPLATNGV